MHPGYLPLGLIAANRSAHPARPPCSRRNRYKVIPRPAFAPGVLQCPIPPAFGLVVRGRGRIDNHSDEVAALLGAELEQLCDDSGGIFCLLCSPQLNVELEHGCEIVVESEPAS